MNLSQYNSLVRSLVKVDATTNLDQAILTVFADMVGRAKFEFMHAADTFDYSFTTGDASYDKTMAGMDEIDEIEVKLTAETLYAPVPIVKPDKLTLIQQGALHVDGMVACYWGLTSEQKHRIEFFPVPTATYDAWRVLFWIEAGSNSIARMPDKWAKTLGHGVNELIGKASVNQHQATLYERGCARMLVREKTVAVIHHPLELPADAVKRNRENLRLA